VSSALEIGRGRVTRDLRDLPQKDNEIRPVRADYRLQDPLRSSDNHRVHDQLSVAQSSFSYLPVEYFGSSPLVMHAVRPTRREAVFNHVQEYTPLDYTASRWTGHW
jgi:hypothetical protein